MWTYQAAVYELGSWERLGLEPENLGLVLALPIVGCVMVGKYYLLGFSFSFNKIIRRTRFCLCHNTVRCRFNNVCDSLCKHKIHAYMDQKDEPWEPTGKAGLPCLPADPPGFPGLPCLNSHDGTTEAAEWAKKAPNESEERSRETRGDERGAKSEREIQKGRERGRAWRLCSFNILRDCHSNISLEQPSLSSMIFF